MAMVKVDLARALAPKEPFIDQEMVNRWNRGAKKTDDLEEELRRLQRDFALLEGAKIKADILQLFKVTTTFVTKDNLSALTMQIRQLEDKLKDVHDDVRLFREFQAKIQDKLNEIRREVAEEFNGVRSRIENLDQQLQALKK